jgi:glycosyltransferase involved in cell wall biosynthesis
LIPGKLSLLIPVFNHERYLPDLFCSLEKQVRQPEEILFSDDVSSDASPRLVEAYVRGRREARLIRQEKNLGITENSNFLLREAHGEYVLTLHSDDGLREAHALDQMTEALDQNPGLAMVTSPRAKISGTNELLGVETKLKPGRYDRKTILRAVLTTEANPLGEPSAVMFRRSALPNGFDPAYRQLWDLKGWLEILRTGEVEVLPSPVVNIREHPGQATRANEKTGRGIEEHLRLFTALLGEADSVLSHREKSVLIYKLRRTAFRHKNLLLPEILASLQKVRKKIGHSAYVRDLAIYRLKKILCFMR